MNKSGFTLLELSIVLVIIGLIIGGITVGQDLIRAAELNAVVKEFQTYQVAVRTFKLKYNALPGDMDNAKDYWGEAAAGSACKTTVGTGTQTCNGNGDNRIESNYSNSHEWFRFWQHLANAEIIPGSFTGVAGSDGTFDSVINGNVPGSNITGAGWTPRYKGYYSGNDTWYRGDYENYLEFGGGTGTVSTYDPILTPAEAHNIDRKIDDGKPATGSIWAVNWFPSCTDSVNTTLDTGDYKVSVSTPACALAFIKATD